METVTPTNPNPAELHKAHSRQEDALAEWAAEELTDADRGALDELNQEAREQRQEDGTEAFRAQQFAAAAVRAAKEQQLAQRDNDWHNNPGSTL